MHDRAVGGVLDHRQRRDPPRFPNVADDPTFVGDRAAGGADLAGRAPSLDYRGTMDGNFYGPPSGYVGGDLDGTVDDGVDIDDADGQFAGTQQLRRNGAGRLGVSAR